MAQELIRGKRLHKTRSSQFEEISFSKSEMTPTNGPPHHVWCISWQLTTNKQPLTTNLGDYASPPAFAQYPDRGGVGSPQLSETWLVLSLIESLGTLLGSWILL